MVVHHDDAGGRFGDRRPKDLARMHQRAVQETARDQHVAQHLALAVQREQVKLLEGEVPQSSSEQASYVIGLADAGGRGPLFSREPRAQLEGGEQAGNFGWTEAADVEQLRRRLGDEAPERSLPGIEQPAGQLKHVLAPAAGADDDRQQLGSRERSHAERPESFARAVGFGNTADGSGHEANIPGTARRSGAFSPRSQPIYCRLTTVRSARSRARCNARGRGRLPRSWPRRSRSARGRAG